VTGLVRTLLLLGLPLFGARRREREAVDAYERLIAENTAARAAHFHYPPRD
jgi:hypothetical protein